MSKVITRRDFLKISSLSVLGVAFRPLSRWHEITDDGMLFRVAGSRTTIFDKPSFRGEVVYRLARDELLHAYYEVISESGYNPLWYRVWGGYVNCAYLQRVRSWLNTPLAYIPGKGLPAEVSVPYTTSMAYEKSGEWKPVYRLRYGSIHWVVDVEEGPDGDAWYKVIDSFYRTYLAPAVHMRPIFSEEISPISPDVPRAEKHIEVSIERQVLTAFEYGQSVFSTKIASGIPQREELESDEIPTETPTGNFHITVKTPCRHMGDREFNEEEGITPLPGVPWVSFFDETGVSFHGTYWHSNFGYRMSHGCVNMQNEDAKWIYRWADPVIEYEQRQVSDWGTRVTIY